MRPRELPAEDNPQAVAIRSQAPGFNEAAGVTRGRRGACIASRLRRSSFNEAAGVTRGRRGERQGVVPRLTASMRPRELPAEDPLCPLVGGLARRASMRPRELPAEDLRPRVPVARHDQLQ